MPMLKIRALQMASPFNHNCNSYTLKINSYNMHGFCQGSSFLDLICNDINPPDLIFLQEHWLPPANIYKLNKFHTNFLHYGISAMEKEVERSILRGRPF